MQVLIGGPRATIAVVTLEFLIRTACTHEWPAIARPRMAAVLSPAGWTCAPADGDGDHVVDCAGTEIAWSAEPNGWQVSFDGPMSEEEAERFVAAAASQIEHETGEPIAWIAI